VHDDGVDVGGGANDEADATAGNKLRARCTRLNQVRHVQNPGTGATFSTCQLPVLVVLLPSIYIKSRVGCYGHLRRIRCSRSCGTLSHQQTYQQHITFRAPSIRKHVSLVPLDRCDIHLHRCNPPTHYLHLLTGNWRHCHTKSHALKPNGDPPLLSHFWHIWPLHSRCGSRTVCYTAIGNYRIIADNPPRTDQDYCYPKVIGYKPAVIMSEIDGTSFSRVGTATADGLTNAFILHPIACGLAFIAGFCAFGGWVGSLIGTFLAVLAWIIALVVMVLDFVVFGVSSSIRVSNAPLE
jgi:hypothetical protein